MIEALRFLTRLPVPGEGSGPARSVPYFPLVGLVLGALGGGAYFGLQFVLPDPVARLLVLFGLVWLYAAFHLDGVSDCADAFYAGRTRDDVLRILGDPRAGTMGVLAIVSVLGIKAACLLSTSPRGVLVALPATILIGHLWMAVSLAAFPRGGSGTSSARLFLPRAGATAVATVVSVVVVLAWAKLAGAVMLLLASPVGLGLAALSFRKLGGINGDSCGAIGQWAECAAWVGWVAGERIPDEGLRLWLGIPEPVWRWPAF